MTMDSSPIPLLQGFGVELEYAIVDSATGEVKSLADKLLVDEAGQTVTDREEGEIGWSNELSLHLVEFKNERPVSDLRTLPAHFQHSVRVANRRLAALGAQLMPAAMHPLFDPRRALLWPHEGHDIYAFYDQLFDCRRHGWANLQSAHLNLAFSGDEEFARLHTAVRLLLPLIPALSASSPYAEGRFSGYMDYRMEVYRTNSARVPAITGLVVPELVLSIKDYHEQILGSIHAAMAPLDPAGVLRHEWCNARGAIARFNRSAVEVRVVDTQECPAADLALAKLISRVVQGLVEERWSSFSAQQAPSTEDLSRLLREVGKYGDAARLTDGAYLDLLGLGRPPVSAATAWRRLAEMVCADGPPGEKAALRMVFEQGPLARRLLRRAGEEPTEEALRALCLELCACLEAGRLFSPA